MNPNALSNELFSKSAAPILFLDFDGTISKRDAIDAILERFADQSWKILEEMWKGGAIGSRECLHEQIALVRASQGEINALLDEIELDAGFAELLKTCRRNSIQTFIVSDGFDYCIGRILSRSGIPKEAQNFRIFSSHLEYASGAWRTAFPYFPTACAHGCATCKPQVMKNLNAHNAPTVFVGDGLSDRYAARAAELVFAKKGLAKYCAAENIEFAAYENLQEVAARLEELLSAKKNLSHRTASYLAPNRAQEVFG